MHLRALDIIACPACSGRLSLSEGAETAPDGHVMEGVLECAGCDDRFAVAGGVPRLAESLPEDARSRTAASFGYEWNRWPRFGWEPGEVEGESPTFDKKTLLSADELDGKLVLEAGCGNGRYVNQAQRRGAEVVGMDLSSAVDAAFANTREMPNVHIVQGNIFRPPFADETFDVMYTIGVLMHTGDAHQAFNALWPKVKGDGIATIHIYKKGTRVYEWVDATLRKRTVDWDREKLLRFSDRGAKFADFLGPYALGWFNSVMRLQAHPSIVYDWYATEIATHHTYPEVREWFSDAGVRIVADNDRPRPGWHEKIKPDLSLTVKGRVPVRSQARTETDGRAASVSGA
jgi:SAM-dependent methyltransferase